MTPIELVLGPNSISAVDIEQACSFATSQTARDVVAVAVDGAHAKRTANLLFGTGVGVVSRLDPALSLLPQARKSAAAGATEINVPVARAEALRDLNQHLGTSIALTLDMASARQPDPDVVKKALTNGADFIAVQPDLATPEGLRDCAQLLTLAGEIEGSAVKLAIPSYPEQALELLLTTVGNHFGSLPARVCVQANDLISFYRR